MNLAFDAALYPYVVVALCAVVQSVFGVGLLLFGTPLFLWGGYSFPVTLGVLLPCSMVVSALQLRADRPEDPAFRRYAVWLAAPAAMGIAMGLLASRRVDIRPIVGALLLASGLIRMAPPVHRYCRETLRRSVPGSLAAIAFIHGLTNMGGALLTVLMTSLHVEKTTVRTHIAAAYLILASAQLLALLVLERPPVDVVQVATLVGLTAATYLAIGRHVFAWSSQAVYHHAVTAFIFVLALMLIF
jgi:uncharacterized membrane protein YfcA